MALKNIIVQCLSTEDREKAGEVLAKSGADVSAGEVYMQGYAENTDISALEEQGLIIEEVPGVEETSLSWLAPGKQQEPSADLLASDGGISSPIQEAGDDSQKVYLIQLRGPIRPEWMEKLKECGVRLTRSIPDFAFKGILNPARESEVAILDFVERVEDYSIAHTLRRLTIAQKQEEFLKEEARGVGQQVGSQQDDKLQPLAPTVPEPPVDVGLAETPTGIITPGHISNLTRETRVGW